MRRASASVLAVWIATLAWACARAAPSDTNVSNFEDLPDANGQTPTDASSATDTAPPPDVAVTPADDAGADTAPPPPPPDAGTDAGACVKVGPSKSCGLVPQCGCGAAETCELFDGTDTKCLGPAGLGVAGDFCVNVASCQQGLSCIYGSTCHPYCNTPGQKCAGSNLGQCIQIVDGADAAVPNFMICEVNCQLQDPNSCGGGGAACFPSGYTTGSDCYATGNKGPNAVCQYLDDCQAGYGCVGPSGGTSHCKRWCRVGMNSDCGGQTCTGFFPPFTIAGVTYGTCP